MLEAKSFPDRFVGDKFLHFHIGMLFLRDRHDTHASGKRLEQ